MYNKEVKQDYIKYYKEINSSIEKDMTITFANIEYLEETYNKDCSCFTSLEIMTFYKSLCTASLQYLMVLNSQLKRYTDYCLNNNLVPDGQNHYLDMDNRILNECLNKTLIDGKIISKELLLKEIQSNSILNSADKCLALALFEGICGQEYCELAYLNIKQLKNGNEIELYSGRTLQISPLLVEYMKQASSEYEYYVYGTEKIRKYIKNDENVFKEPYNAVESRTGNVLAKRRQQLVRKLHRMKDSTGSQAYSKVGLMESGRIDLIKTYMKKEKLESIEVIKKHRDEIEYRYGKIPSISRYLIMYGDYLG